MSLAIQKGSKKRKKKKEKLLKSKNRLKVDEIKQPPQVSPQRSCLLLCLLDFLFNYSENSKVNRFQKGIGFSFPGWLDSTLFLHRFDALRKDRWSIRWILIKISLCDILMASIYETFHNFLGLFYPIFLLLALRSKIGKDNTDGILVLIFAISFASTYTMASSRRLHLSRINKIKLSVTNGMRAVFFRQYIRASFSLLHPHDGFFAQQLIEDKLQRAIQLLTLVPKMISFIICTGALLVMGSYYLNWLILLIIPTIVVSFILFALLRKLKGRYEAQYMSISSDQANLLNLVINRMNMIKLTGMEPTFIQQFTHYRDNEDSRLSLKIYLKAFTNLVVWVMPSLMISICVLINSSLEIIKQKGLFLYMLISKVSIAFLLHEVKAIVIINKQARVYFKFCSSFEDFIEQFSSSLDSMPNDPNLLEGEFQFKHVQGQQGKIFKHSFSNIFNVHSNQIMRSSVSKLLNSIKQQKQKKKVINSFLTYKSKTKAVFTKDLRQSGTLGVKKNGIPFGKSVLKGIRASNTDHGKIDLDQNMMVGNLLKKAFLGRLKTQKMDLSYGIVEEDGFSPMMSKKGSLGGDQAHKSRRSNISSTYRSQNKGTTPHSYKIARGEYVCIHSQGPSDTESIMQLLMGERVIKGGYWQSKGDISFYKPDSWFYFDNKSLLDNILLGSKPDFIRLKEVLKLADLDLEPKKVLGGMIINQKRLSFQEKQQIITARFLYSDSLIYIFGGFFNNLPDQVKISKLNSILENPLFKMKTLIVISGHHYIKSKADLVLKIAQGKLKIEAFDRQEAGSYEITPVGIRKGQSSKGRSFMKYNPSIETPYFTKCRAKLLKNLSLGFTKGLSSKISDVLSKEIGSLSNVKVTHHLFSNRLQFIIDIVTIIQENEAKERNFYHQDLKVLTNDQLLINLKNFLKENIHEKSILPMTIVLFISTGGFYFAEAWLAFCQDITVDSLPLTSKYMVLIHFIMHSLSSIASTGVFIYYGHYVRQVAYTTHMKLLKRLFSLRVSSLQKQHYLQTFVVFQKEQSILDKQLQSMVFYLFESAITMAVLVIELNMLSVGSLVLHTFVYLVILYYFVNKTVKLAEPLATNYDVKKTQLYNIMLSLYNLCSYYKTLSKQEILQKEYYLSSQQYSQANHYIKGTVWAWVENRFTLILAFSITVVLLTSFLFTRFSRTLLMEGTWPLFLAVITLTRLMQLTSHFLKEYVSCRVTLTTLSRIQHFLTEGEVESLDNIKYKEICVGEERQVLCDSPFSIDAQGITVLDKNVVKVSNLSIRIHQVAKIAIYGYEDSGIEDLVQVFLGLKRPSSGKFLFFGENLDSVSPESIRKVSYYCQKDPFLLGQSILDNIDPLGSTELADVKHLLSFLQLSSLVEAAIRKVSSLPDWKSVKKDQMQQLQLIINLVDRLIVRAEIKPLNDNEDTLLEELYLGLFSDLIKNQTAPEIDEEETDGSMKIEITKKEPKKVKPENLKVSIMLNNNPNDPKLNSPKKLLEESRVEKENNKNTLKLIEDDFTEFNQKNKYISSPNIHHKQKLIQKADNKGKKFYQSRFDFDSKKRQNLNADPNSDHVFVGRDIKNKQSYPKESMLDFETKEEITKNITRAFVSQKTVGSGKNIPKMLRRLVSLAKAILKLPHILYFDEEALEFGVRKSWESNFAKLSSIFEDRVMIGLMHSTRRLMFFDHVIVIHKGKIIERGQPKQLLSNQFSFISRRMRKEDKLLYQAFKDNVDYEELVRQSYSEKNVDLQKKKEKEFQDRIPENLGKWEDLDKHSIPSMIKAPYVQEKVHTLSGISIMIDQKKEEPHEFSQDSSFEEENDYQQDDLNIREEEDEIFNGKML